MLTNPVAVQKVVFSERSRKSARINQNEQKTEPEISHGLHANQRAEAPK
jgi:hypothetical protein